MMGAMPGQPMPNLANDQRFVDVSSPGIGYDTYVKRALMKRMAQQMAPAYSMPAPPPRFPTPGRMDGARTYPAKAGKWGMGAPMMANPAMYGMR